MVLQMRHFFALSMFRNEQDTQDQPLLLPLSNEGLPFKEEPTTPRRRVFRVLTCAGLVVDIPAAAAAAAARPVALLVVVALEALCKLLLIFDADVGVDDIPNHAPAEPAASSSSTTAVVGVVLPLLLVLASSSTPRAAICRATVKPCSSSRSSSAPTRWATALSLESLGLYARLMVHRKHSRAPQPPPSGPK